MKKNLFIIRSSALPRIPWDIKHPEAVIVCMEKLQPLEVDNLVQFLNENPSCTYCIGLHWQDLVDGQVRGISLPPSAIRYVHCPYCELPPVEVVGQLENHHVRLVVTGIQAQHDDDPSWILSRFLDHHLPDSAIYCIDFLAEFEDSWEFAKQESPQFPDELQIADIVELSKHHHLCLSLNFNSTNLMEILETFGKDAGYWTKLPAGVNEVPDAFVAMMKVVLG